MELPSSVIHFGILHDGAQSQIALAQIQVYHTISVQTDQCNLHQVRNLCTIHYGILCDGSQYQITLAQIQVYHTISVQTDQCNLHQVRTLCTIFLPFPTY